MRARNLKPGFFKNELLAECEPLARILFSGLWCMADREGRLECRPKRIKAELLPYDNCDVLKLLDQLRAGGFIVVYKYEAKYFLEIPTFTEHQNCHVKESASTIPAPDESDACTVAAGPLSSFLLPLTESPMLYKGKHGAGTEKRPKEETEKKSFGKYVRLTQAEYNRLLADFGEKKLEFGISKLDYSINRGEKYLDHNLTLRNWDNRGWLTVTEADRGRAMARWEKELEGIGV